MKPTSQITMLVSVCLLLLAGLVAGCSPKPEADATSPPPTSAPAPGSGASSSLPTKPLSTTGDAKELESQRQSNAAAYADYMAKQKAQNRP